MGDWDPMFQMAVATSHSETSVILWLSELLRTFCLYSENVHCVGI